MKPLLLLALLVCSYFNAGAQRDTIPVFFETGIAALSEKVADGLDNAIYKDVLHGGQTLQIVGYADYVGEPSANDALSRARAATVKRFLLSYGFEPKNITICIGKGEVERTGVQGNEGFARDRRVDIVVVHAQPSLPQMAVAKPAITPRPTLPPKEAPSAPRNIKPTPVKLEDIATAKPNQTIRLENFYFYPGRHVIRPESRPIIDRLKTVLDNFPNLKINIEGHVCCVAKEAGDALDIDTHDLFLSLNRAREVYAQLVKKGIDEDRLTFAGFGGTRPLVEEHTEEDADMNRRVEIRVVENK